MNEARCFPYASVLICRITLSNAFVAATSCLVGDTHISSTSSTVFRICCDFFESALSSFCSVSSHQRLASDQDILSILLCKFDRSDSCVFFPFCLSFYYQKSSTPSTAGSSRHGRFPPHESYSDADRRMSKVLLNREVNFQVLVSCRIA